MLENFERRLLLNYFKNQIGRNSSHEYKIKISGDSMLPTIKNGDIIKVCSPNKEQIKTGDIICYDNKSYFVLHRVVGVEKTGDHIGYITKGDNMSKPDMNIVNEDQIFGVFKQKESPFMYIWYSCGKVACIISLLDDIKEFIISIYPSHMVSLDYPYEQTNVKINILIYQNDGSYFVEIFSNNYREKYMHKTIEEVKGNIYSILFHAEWLKNEYAGCISLHAGGIKMGTQLVLILGVSGSGKSYLIYCLAKRGYEYFSDEKIHIQLINDKLMVIPFYTPIMLRRDVALKNNISEKTYVSKDDVLEEKHPIGINNINNIIDEPQKATGIIVVPKWSSKSETVDIHKVSDSDAFSIVAQNLLTSSDVKKLDSLLHIIKEFDVYHINYGNSEICADSIERLINERLTIKS